MRLQRRCSPAAEVAEAAEAAGAAMVGAAMAAAMAAAEAVAVAMGAVESASGVPAGTCALPPVATAAGWRRGCTCRT